MTNNYRKFEDSDAYLFWNAVKMTGGRDIDTVRHFCKSMKIYNKELVNASQKGIERE